MSDNHLYWKRLDLPIETLGLPNEVVNKLKETGIKAIVDCVNVFYPSGPFDVTEIDHPYAFELKDIVRSKLEAHGFKPVARYPERYLYIPIEEIGLPDTFTEGMKVIGITSVADCIDFCASDFSVGVPRWPWSIHEVIVRDMKLKLEEHGYWPLD